jgi:hypothetical protein
MGRTRRTHGKKRNAHRILIRKPEGKRVLTLVRLSVDVDIILKWILKIGCGNVDWIQLAQDRVQWRILVNLIKELSEFIKDREFS